MTIHIEIKTVKQNTRVKTKKIKKNQRKQRTVNVTFYIYKQKSEDDITFFSSKKD